MHRCKSCSAPLSGIFCDYCGSRNNVDLSAYKPMNVRPGQVRNCPVCHTRMQTIDVGKKIPFLIERCESCFGLFFDKEELEMMIELSVKGSRNVNIKVLQELTENPRFVDVVVYRRCPVCLKQMNRKNYAGRSGVIMDECAEHGIWLDPGELRQIMEWIKAGGLKRAQRQNKLSSLSAAKKMESRKERKSRHYFGNSYHDASDDFGIFEGLLSLLS